MRWRGHAARRLCNCTIQQPGFPIWLPGHIGLPGHVQPTVLGALAAPGYYAMKVVKDTGVTVGQN